MSEAWDLQSAIMDLVYKIAIVKNILLSKKPAYLPYTLWELEESWKQLLW